MVFFPFKADVDQVTLWNLGNPKLKTQQSNTFVSGYNGSMLCLQAVPVFIILCLLKKEKAQCFRNILQLCTTTQTVCEWFTYI